MPEYRNYSLDQWLEHIQNQHWRTMDLTLDRVNKVWQALGSPKAKTNIVFAGTNGKGSSIAMMEGVLKHAGQLTGAFTSPHLVRFNERIRINGNNATDAQITAGFCAIEQARNSFEKAVPLTYFEFNTLCALLLFSQFDVEVALLEVGMGGRLDAINIVHNDLVVITSIGLDHEQWLGSDPETIGREKAGIIKTDGLAIFSGENIPKSICEVAQGQNAQLLIAGRDFQISNNHGTLNWNCRIDSVPMQWKSIDGLIPPFHGHHQIANLSGVIAALALTAGWNGVDPLEINKGLGRSLISARCQVLQQGTDNQPEIIIDVAHNEDSASELADFLSSRPQCGRTFAVVGILEDKSLEPIIGPFIDQIQHWFLATLSGERGQNAQQLGEKLDNFDKSMDWSGFDSPVLAFKQATNGAKPGDRIVIFGSFYTVGDILAHLEQTA